MQTIDEIAGEMDFTVAEERDLAMQKMRKIDDLEIERLLLHVDASNTVSAKTKLAASLAKAEQNRRNTKSQRKLVVLSTFVSGSIGIIGTIFGVVLSYLLKS